MLNHLQCNTEEHTLVGIYAAVNAAENVITTLSTNCTKLQYNTEEHPPVGTDAAENAVEILSRINTKLQWNTRIKKIPRRRILRMLKTQKYVENCKGQSRV